ncbi:DUF4835 family protein [Bacteroidota bacterium]
MSTNYGQELNANVTVSYEQLTNDYKERLVDFNQAIEEYFNSSQFTEDVWEWPKITCNFTIFFTSASDETKYSAQVVITSQRPVEGTQMNSLMLSIMDNSWAFDYERGQALYFNQTDFNPLTSFLDFYAYLIIGFDMDSYEPYSGSDYFNEAMNITGLGRSSGYSDSWQIKSSSYNKRALIEDITEATFQQFRQDFTDYHYNGLDLYYKDKNAGLKNIIKLVQNLESVKKKLNRRSVLLNVFFEAKHKELIDYVKKYDDKESVFEILKKVDPERVSKYIEAIEE